MYSAWGDSNGHGFSGVGDASWSMNHAPNNPAAQPMAQNPYSFKFQPSFNKYGVPDQNYRRFIRGRLGMSQIPDQNTGVVPPSGPIQQQQFGPLGQIEGWTPKEQPGPDIAAAPPANQYGGEYGPVGRILGRVPRPRSLYDEIG